MQCQITKFREINLFDFTSFFWSGLKKINMFCLGIVSLISILIFRLCHGSHVPSPGERTLIGNPEKSKNKNQPKFVLKNGKWETISSGSSDCGCDNPPIIRLEIKSHRPQIITTTVLRPCEPNNSHIEWDPTIRTTENWDLIDVVSVFFTSVSAIKKDISSNDILNPVPVHYNSKDRQAASYPCSRMIFFFKFI